MKAVVARQVRGAFIAASRPMRLFAGGGGCPVLTEHGPFSRKSRLAPDGFPSYAEGFPDRITVDPLHPLAGAALEWLAGRPRLARRAVERGTLVATVTPISAGTEISPRCECCGGSFQPAYGEFARCSSCKESQLAEAESATGVE